MTNIKRIRVFETNSSSTHTVSVDKGNTFTTKTFFYVGDVSSSGVLRLRPGTYGWEWESYSSASDKFNYLLTFCIEKVNDMMHAHPNYYWKPDEYFYRVDKSGNAALYYDADIEEKFGVKDFPDAFERRSQLRYAKIVNALNLRTYPDTTNKNGEWYGQCWQDLFDLMDIARHHSSRKFDVVDLRYNDYRECYIDHQSHEDFDSLSSWLHYHDIPSALDMIACDKYSIKTGNDNEESPW